MGTIFFQMLFLFAFVALVTAQGVSPKCKSDLQAALDDIVAVAQDIAATQSACQGDNKTACIDDINAIVKTFGSIATDLQETAHDCFGASGNGTLCAKMVEKVIQDVGVVSEDAVAAVKACSQNPKGDECTLDLQAVSGDAAKAVLDLSAAVTVCAGGQAPSLGEVLQMVQGSTCKSDCETSFQECIENCQQPQ